MNHTLKLSADLRLPVDVVTQAVGIIAKRRVGKSFTARRFAEQLHHCGQQVVIVDPKGDWWGIRSSADGKGPGLPVVMLGGERGDVRLEPASGELVARLVVEQRISALIDISLFSKGEVATFMASFLESLYRLKAQEKFRTPMMLIVDEADAIAPQRPQPKEARMLGAAEDVVRRGGQRGIGCTLITQRAAVLNKNVLTQVQLLVALRTLAPQDLDALNAWIDVHGTQEQRDTLMESLPSLPVGDAWFWSPGWPTDDGIFERAHVLPIETFDSGATPKAGEKRTEPKTLADVDLDAVRSAMADVIKRAAEEDPRALRKRVRELEKALAEKPIVEPKVVELPVLKPEQLGVVRALGEDLKATVCGLREMSEKVAAALAALSSAVVAASNARAPRIAPAVLHQPKPAAVRRERASAIHVDAGAESVGAGGLRRMLIALAQRPQGLSARQVGVRAQLSSKSGTFDTYLSKARKAGWLDGSRDRLVITNAGVAALGSFEDLPEGSELLRYWVNEVGGGASRMLEALANAYPNTLTKDELGEAAGLSSKSGTFDTYLSRLRSLELVEGRSELRLSEELVD